MGERSFNASACQRVPHVFYRKTQVLLLPTKLISQVPRPKIDPRTPGMISRHASPQLQSMDKRSVWKLNSCPVSLNLRPQESHNFDMLVLGFIRGRPIDVSIFGFSHLLQVTSNLGSNPGGF